MAEEKILPTDVRVGVAAGEAVCESAADALARELYLPRLGVDDPAASESGCDAVLVVWQDRLELREPVREAGRRGGAEAAGVSCDFVGGAFGHRLRTGHVAAELLVKAVRGRTRDRSGAADQPLRVVDATAGLGRDAALLALAGMEVTAIERSGVMTALLRDGLRRAAAAAVASAEAAEAEGWGRIARLRVVQADAVAWLSGLAEAERPDVVLLDPMFPPRSKSALVKKQMRLCRLVSGDDADAPELLEAASGAARRRVVVKRPLHAPPLAGRKPTATRKGRRIRYDIYTPQGEGGAHAAPPLA